ncbi:MAG: hypothetical protein LBR49_06695 [Tannerella sp.]|jgi:hypothetical protein|nr:hypothetical protein [Tannerella sp.]
MSYNKREIAQELSEKISRITCPMCQNNRFVLADGYFNNQLQRDIGSYSIGGAGIPTVAIICENCGFVSQHALGSLGLLPKKGGNDGK